MPKAITRREPEVSELSRTLERDGWKLEIDIREVELHWYEAHGIGKRDLKIKRYLDQP